MLSQPLIGVYLALWLAPLVGMMHAISQTTTHWLVGCFTSALCYLVLSLRLDLFPNVPVWLEGLRWALFGAAIYSFVQYRLARRRQR